MSHVAKKNYRRDPTHLYYLCSEDIDADQLRSYMYRASDLRLRFRIYISKKYVFSRRGSYNIRDSLAHKGMVAMMLVLCPSSSPDHT